MTTHSIFSGPLTRDDIRSLRRLFREVREMPAFRDVRLRFSSSLKNMGECVEYTDGNFDIVINRRLSYTEAFYTLAHEMAHVVASMEDDHGPVFGIVEEALRNVLFLLASQISEKKKARNTKPCT